jgi:hypothetical protein
LTNPICSVLDDILAAAYSAFVRLCHLDHPADFGSSLTPLPLPCNLRR